jgi:hypothetical protein
MIFQHDCKKLKCKKVYVIDNEYFYYKCVNINTSNYTKIVNKKKRKTCIECSKYPSFNKKNTSIPIYCFDHKMPDHVNVRSKKCLNKFCNKQPSFGLKKGISLYCLKHIPNINYFESRSKKCIICNITRPSFGYVNKKPLYCFNDKPNDTFKVIK